MFVVFIIYGEHVQMFVHPNSESLNFSRCWEPLSAPGKKPKNYFIYQCTLDCPNSPLKPSRDVRLGSQSAMNARI